MRSLILFAFAPLFATAAFAADPSDDHQVTVEVLEVNTLQVLGGDLVLTLDELDPSDPSKFLPVSDATASLAWSTNAQDRKITVESDLASPRFGLAVSAIGVSGNGAAAGSVILAAENGAQDLVTGIATENAGATLQYVASADVAAGIGAESHTVTYTLTAM